MRKIGGMFHYEPSKPIENGYFSRICSPKDDLAFAMSGRCGIYFFARLSIMNHSDELFSSLSKFIHYQRRSKKN